MLESGDGYTGKSIMVRKREKGSTLTREIRQTNKELCGMC